MTIKVVSNTESVAAKGEQNLAEATGKVEETKQSASAVDEQQDETTEESDSSDNAEDSSDDSDEVEAQEGSEEQSEKPKKKSGFQKRVEKLNRRISDRERELEYWKSKALNGAESKGVEEKPKVSESRTDGRPIPDDFENHDEYLEALVDWKADQKLSARDAKDKEAQVKSEFQQKVESHREKVKAFVKEHADFQSVIEDVDDIVLSPIVQDAILDSGPGFMYELAKNREELERINALPAMQAARELGKFEARLIAAKEKPEAKLTKTKAPPPLKTVGSNSSGSGHRSIFDPDLSQADYERLRRKQMST